MIKLTADQQIEQATKVRKAWASGKYKTRGALAERFSLTYNQVRGILTGRVKNGGNKAAPSGNYREYSALGKTVLIYDDGRVWSIISNRFIGSTIPLGYRTFSLRDPITDALINFRVSRVMLEVFVRKPKKGEWARHLDDDPTNNNLDNLAWGYPVDNSEDSLRNGTRAHGEITNVNKLTNKIVRRLVREYDGEPYRTFAKEFVIRHGLSVQPLTIVRILRGQLWTHITGWERAKQGTNAKLDKKAVHSIHKNFKRFQDELNFKDFSEKFAEHLKAKGYAVSPRAIIAALRGDSWHDVYKQHWK